jgi:hypothetical protein
MLGYFTRAFFTGHFMVKAKCENNSTTRIVVFLCKKSFKGGHETCECGFIVCGTATVEIAVSLLVVAFERGCGSEPSKV